MAEPEETPLKTIPRPRGALEDMMREVCVQIANGNLAAPDGELWTTAKICNEVFTQFPGSGAKPSVGAAADNLKRWREVGFAEINDRPLAFLSFVNGGDAADLVAAKEAHQATMIEGRKAARAARKAARDAEKAAQAAAAKADEVATEEDLKAIAEAEEDIAAGRTITMEAAFTEDSVPDAQPTTEVLNITYTPDNAA